jgi:hypothetical protein
MLLTPSHIRHYLAISSTIVLGLGTLFIAKSESIGFNQEAGMPAEQTTEAKNKNPYLLSKVGQSEVRFQIDTKNQLSSKITPQDPIDWDNTRIEIGESLDLNF